MGTGTNFRSTTGDRRPLRRKSVPVPVFFLLGLFLAAAPGWSELVVLTGGDVLKVTAFEAIGDDARLTLPNGGRLTLPLERIERVVDDEIVASPEAEPLPADPGVVFAIEFKPGQGRPATPFAAEIATAAEAARLNPHLVAAVVGAESAFQPRAVSHKGARGLMQLMPATGRRFGAAPAELFEPAKNLAAGTRYLRWLLDRFEGNLLLALAAYNAGEGQVDRYGGVPPFRETRRYVRRVYALLGVEAATGR